MNSEIKKGFIHKRLFILLYVAVMIINFTIPFFLPSCITGAYLFWIVLPILVIVYGFIFLNKEQ